MLSLFSEVKKQIKFKKDHPTIESLVFQSMKVAMVASLLGCVLVTAKTYIGDNINCVTGFTKQEHKAIETYCFISSTFSMVNLTEADSPYPGVGPVGDTKEEDLKRHAYYQWVPMVLAIQASILYFPRWIWKNLMDKSKFKSVLGDLDALHIDDTPKTTIQVSASYMAKSLTTHTQYAVQFLLCEVTAFTISLGNLFFTNAFLGGNFFSYGRGALYYLGGDVTDINNPLNEVFPKIAKCTWRKFGPTGSIQMYDAMCVLPLNIVNEKTFVLLWVVYIMTCAVIGVTLLLHIILALSKKLRNNAIMKRMKSSRSKEAYQELEHKVGYGDWFILYHLSSRMVGKYFEDWIVQLKEDVEK